MGPAAEGEELAGEDGRAVGGLPDLGQVLPRLGSERALVQQQGDVAQDAGEQVVEVVRDAAGELGDLAGAAELREPLLQRPPVGDVGGAAAVAEELAVGAVARLAGAEEPAVLAVLMQHAGTRAGPGRARPRPRRTPPATAPGRPGAGGPIQPQPSISATGRPVNSLQRSFR